MCVCVCPSIFAFSSPTLLKVGTDTNFSCNGFKNNFDIKYLENLKHIFLQFYFSMSLLPIRKMKQDIRIKLLNLYITFSFIGLLVIKGNKMMKNPYMFLT